MVSSTEEKPNRIERLSFHNNRDVILTLVVEPWGAMYPMPPDSRLDVTASGPAEGDQVEIAVGQDRIEVWGWRGATYAVFRDGVRLGGSDVPSP